MGLIVRKLYGERKETLINVLIIVCIVAAISGSVFGVLAAYAELIAKEPLYGVYMKAAAILFGFAGVVASLLSAIREKYTK
jgi:hypothetical protein